MILEYKASDLLEIDRIHKKFYTSEFGLNDFTDSHSLAKFIIRDENGEIVSSASLRAITEIVAITDKNKPVKHRREALFELLEALSFTNNTLGFGQMHVATQDNLWEKHLREIGFKETKGKVMVIET